MIEAILNRLRGTGVIFTVFNFGITGSNLYALYLGIITYIITSNIWSLPLMFLAFRLGESFGWGEWVGMLTETRKLTEQDLERCYNDQEGKHFPFIFHIANFFIKEKANSDVFEINLNQYLYHAEIALFFRGVFWFLPIYLCLYFFNVIDLYFLCLAVLTLGVSFPFACILSKRVKYTKTFWKLSFSEGWENQEVIYGFIQGVVFWFCVLI